MRSQHLRRALGSDHRASTDFTIETDAAAKDSDVSAAWAIAFVVCALLALAIHSFSDELGRDPADSGHAVRRGQASQVTAPAPCAARR